MPNARHTSRGPFPCCDSRSFCHGKQLPHLVVIRDACHGRGVNIAGNILVNGADVGPRGGAGYTPLYREPRFIIG